MAVTPDIIGDKSPDEAEIGDFYCLAADVLGYVLPVEAASMIDRHDYVGVVFRVGREASDNSDYSKPLVVDGPAITVAHSSADADNLRFEYGRAILAF